MRFEKNARATLQMEPSLTCYKIPACPACGAANPRGEANCPQCASTAPATIDYRVADVAFGGLRIPLIARMLLGLANVLRRLAQQIGDD